MIKMVVFDMAGTTVNEGNVVYKTLQKAINNAGHSASLEQVLDQGAGKEKLQAIKDVLSFSLNEDTATNQAEQIYADFLNMLKTAYKELEVTTFAGTTELFEYLHAKGIKVVLNTGYDQQTAESLLTKLQWQRGQEFDLLVTADDVERGRPYPDMINLAMHKLAIEDPKTVIKVGDSAVDIQEGKAAECGITLGVTTGAQTAQQLLTAAPDYVIDSLTDIQRLV